MVPPPPACTVHVPGDYATIQGAITALRAAGTAGTVCVADGTYAETLNGDFGTAPLIVTGTSAAKVKVNGNVMIPNFVGYPAPITFSNMSIHGSVISNKSFGLSACAVDGGLQIGLSDYYSAGYMPTTVLVDACDLSAPGNTDTIGISYAPNMCGGALNVTVTNSYLHGAETGLAIAFGLCGSGKVDFIHNTVQGLTGIYVGGSNASVPGRFVSNLVTGSTTGIMQTQVYGDFHDNALFGNTTNYGGLAAPGMGYVTSNPKLTSTMPPGPGVGSPLIAAGDPALVTAHDFFGANRNGRADIGAVEAP